jgi:transposase InsO family protein
VALRGRRWQAASKLTTLEYAWAIESCSATCRELGVPRSTFYRWKKAFAERGRAGLVNRKPVGIRWPTQISEEAVERILQIRREHRMGPQRIAWYLERYHGIRVSCSTVYRTLIRRGEGPLPRRSPRRSLHTRRYAKSVPGHQIQMDVKVLSLRTAEGEPVRRFQYTAVDDATRIRTLKIYRQHNQKSAIDFADHVIAKFPFRIHTVQTDRGHEFQALFHWHVEDQGIRHIYIKPRSPELNGKVERSHRTDEEEFYQLLTYTDDVDLNQKLSSWESFYNYDRPHGAFGGKTPYEILRSLLVPS